MKCIVVACALYCHRSSLRTTNNSVKNIYDTMNSCIKSSGCARKIQYNFVSSPGYQKIRFAIIFHNNVLSSSCALRMCQPLAINGCVIRVRCHSTFEYILKARDRRRMPLLLLFFFFFFPFPFSSTFRLFAQAMTTNTLKAFYYNLNEARSVHHRIVKQNHRKCLAKCFHILIRWYGAYLPVYSSGYGIMYPSGLGRGVLPTQKNASGPVPSYANDLINIVDSSTANTSPWKFWFRIFG